MSDSDYTLEWRGECAWFRLTRDAKRNAITGAILAGLESCCDELDAGRGRALIVTGEGDRAFCAGTDLSESASLAPEASRAKGDRARNLLVRIYRSAWTSIAVLNGLAYGGGLELALACTFRVAAPGVKLSLPEIKLGVLPSYGGTQLLPAVVGRARALDPADAESLPGEAEALAEAILRHSQFVIDRVRRCVEASGAEVTDEGLAVERQAVLESLDSEDAKEGVIAFLQKREPSFKHR
jgi:enoyl-CoA hydratase